MIINYRAKEIGIVFLIMCVALWLRIYHIDKLAIFLSDQAIDSFAVNNIISGSFTLLGPRASVGQFFNGPIVYYLMAPFYFLFRGDPLAGTFFQITLQIATIPFLYVLAKRLGGTKAGLISIIIFTFSPLLINYSRATFNSYPAILFSTVILYFITATRPSNIYIFVAGILTGMLVQMHYFLYLYAFGYLVYLIIQSKDIKKSAVFLFGSFIGLTPFLVFELRHNFFNIRAILSSGSSIIDQVSIWGRVGNIGTAMGSLFGIVSGLGLVILLLVCLLVLRKNIDARLRMVFLISLSSLLVSVVFYKGVLQTHYVIGFTIIFIVALSSVLTKLFPFRILVFISIVYILCFCIFQNKIFLLPAEQDGFGLADERVVASLISRWKKTNIPWNITQDVQRDNRAMPLRYLLSLDKSLTQPLSMEDYQSNKELFVISAKSKKLSDIKTWEVISFGTKYQIINTMPINSEYSLVYLGK